MSRITDIRTFFQPPRRGPLLTFSWTQQTFPPCKATAIKWCDEGGEVEVTDETDNVITRGHEDERAKMDDFNSISSQETTLFRPKYIKQTNVTESFHPSPSNINNDNEEGIFAAASNLTASN